MCGLPHKLSGHLIPGRVTPLGIGWLWRAAVNGSDDLQTWSCECTGISGAFGWYDNYVDTRTADAVDVNWEVGKKYVVGRRDSTWLLHEMGFFFRGSVVHRTSKPSLRWSKMRLMCDSMVCISLYMRYRSGLSLLSRLETLVASVYSPEEMVCWNPDSDINTIIQFNSIYE